MEQTLTYPTADRFSWRRIGRVARFYYPSLRTQMIVYPIIAAAGALFEAIAGYFDLGSLISGVFGVAITFMIYFAPAVLTGRARDLDVNLPALWSEKAFFLIAYFIVAVPVMIAVPQMVINTASYFIQGYPNQLFDVNDGHYLIFGKWISIDGLDMLVPLVTCLYVVCRSNKATFGKAALWSVVSLIAIGVASAAYVITMISIAGFAHVGEMSDADPSMIMTMLGIDKLVLTMALVCAAYVLFMLYMTARAIKNKQI